MSNTTLGLDLGTNSIGWAILDDSTQSIVAAGVRAFPEGVDRTQQGGEKSKSQSRREARGQRRQIARRAGRKAQLRTLLGGSGLLPDHPSELQRLFNTNPYALRCKGLSEPLTLHEFGRVLLHLAQRRGFLSNRKTDRSKASETKGMLAEMGELASRIEESGCQTLGEYLSGLDTAFDHTKQEEAEKVRSRHTRRSMYESEFEALWQSQAAHHKCLKSEGLKEQVRRIIFYQRRMYWPASVVGRCELEPKERRCKRGDRAAQRFRILQEVNNLRLLGRDTGGDGRPLSDHERSVLVEYLAGGKERKFDQIRKKLGLADDVQFNFERAERNKLKGHETDAALASRKCLGKRWWDLPDTTKDAVVEVLLGDQHDDDTIACLVDSCSLTQEEAEHALSAHLPEGHVNYSRKAIQKLLPHLERGLALMANDATDSALHAAGYLRPDELVAHPRDFLPPSPDMPNPIVRRALVEVRKVVNAVIREFGKPGRIHVELAREAKKSFEQRRELLFDNAKRRKEREAAKARIEEHGVEPKRRTIDKYRLWQEQGELCPYCGKKIGLAQLLTGEVDIDHILPRWRSMDDSLANKVTAHRACNAAKGDKTPREWLEDSDPDRYAEVLRIIRTLPFNKQRKFQQQDIQLDDFIQRQLTDTAYISRCVSTYLRCLGTDVVCTRGQLTADLRHWWGLNTILNADGSGRKNRADHRHHAIDAVVIALTDRKRLQAAARARGVDMPLPWPFFPDQVEKLITDMAVSHRSSRHLHGALHESTFYGATLKKQASADASDPVDRPWAKGWVEAEDTVVRRKHIGDIKTRGHIEKVRDEAIREILRGHLRGQGIDPDKAGEFPGSAFKGENIPRMPSGVPIKRVRLIEKGQTFRPVSDRRPYQYVKPGNNHHIVYRAPGEGGKWSAEVVTMWEAARRVRARVPIVHRTARDGAAFVMSLSIGEMFEIDGQDGQRLLCVVRKMDQSNRVDYRLHTDARESAEIKKDNLYLSPERMRKLSARKVVVDTIGRIRRAND